MNAIQLLKSEHDKAKRAFEEIQNASPEQRGEIWSKLEPELKVHEQMEETALYEPAARDASDETLKEWEEEHHEEVADAEALIDEIDGLDPASDEWLDKVEELLEALEHHIQEEEGDIWPRIQRVWDQTKLDQAGEQMAALKREKMPRAA